MNDTVELGEQYRCSGCNEKTGFVKYQQPRNTNFVNEVRCVNCFEVESRFPTYLHRNKRAWEFVVNVAKNVFGYSFKSEHQAIALAYKHRDKQIAETLRNASRNAGYERNSEWLDTLADELETSIDAAQACQMLMLTREDTK